VLSLPFAMSQSEPLLLPLLDVMCFFLHGLDDKTISGMHSPRCGLVLGTGCLLLSAVGSVKDLACTV